MSGVVAFGVPFTKPWHPYGDELALQGGEGIRSAQNMPKLYQVAAENESIEHYCKERTINAILMTHLILKLMMMYYVRSI